MILCTGYSERISPEDENLAADSLLFKPVDKAALSRAVRTVLDGNRENRRQP